LNVVELLVLIFLLSFPAGLSVWLGDLLGVGTWPVALAILLGALALLRTRWSQLAVPVAVSASLLLIVKRPWPWVPVLGLLILYLAAYMLRWLETIRFPGVRHKHWGDELLRANDHERAIEEYSQALAAGVPDPAAVHCTRGLARARLRLFDEAIADFDHTLGLSPEFDPAYYHRGLAYHARGEHARALADLNQVVERMPNWGEIRLQRGLVRAVLGQHREALEDIEKAISLDAECRARARTEKGFASLRDDPEFQRLVGSEDESGEGK
jgi:tetratricopeptide (TPR) repeat protein